MTCCNVKLRTNMTVFSVSLTNGVNLIHKDDAWLVVPGIVEHFSDQSGTFPNVFIHNGAGHHLQHKHHYLIVCTAVWCYDLAVDQTLTLRKLQSS